MISYVQKIWVFSKGTWFLLPDVNEATFTGVGFRTFVCMRTVHPKIVAATLLNMLKSTFHLMVSPRSPLL
jgi:hypothetical protein